METTALHNSSRKLSKLKSLTGTISPINTDSKLIRYLCSGDAFSSPIVTAKFTSGSNNHNNNHNHNRNNENNSFGRKSSSSFSSFSPLSSIENVMMMQSPSFRTPPQVMKVFDDDVLVMDEVLLESPVSSKGSRASSFRYLTSSPDYSSGGGDDGSSSFKMELCRSWENYGHCRYGSKCQFAHGNEDIRPTGSNTSNRLDRSPLPRSYAHAVARHSFPPSDRTEAAAAPGTQANIKFNESEYPSLTASTSPTIRASSSREPRNSGRVKSLSSSHAGPEELSNKENLKPIITDEELPEKSPTIDGTSPTTSNKVKPEKSPTVDSTIPTGGDKEFPENGPTVDTNHQDWSPLDDSIEVVLPESTATNSQSFREAVDDYSKKILYGPRTGKRKPGFPDISEE